MVHRTLQLIHNAVRKTRLIVIEAFAKMQLMAMLKEILVKGLPAYLDSNLHVPITLLI